MPNDLSIHFLDAALAFPLYPVNMDARQWSRAAWALALLFGSFPVVGRLVLGDWEFGGSAEIACLLLLAGIYFHLRSRRRYSACPDPATLLDQANRFAASAAPTGPWRY